MNTKALFPCGGEPNLILGTGTEKKIYFLRSTNKINFLTKFPHLGKNCQFDEGLKI